MYIRKEIPGGVISATIAKPTVPRFHSRKWWAYSAKYDSDTGPFSDKAEAQQWIDEIRQTKK